MSEAPFSLAQGIVGGIVAIAISAAGHELIKRLLPNRDKQLDIQVDIQKQHREDMVWLRGEVSRLNKELDVWRTKYFEVLGNHTKEISSWTDRYSELQDSYTELRREHTVLKDRYDLMEDELELMRRKIATGEYDATD